MPDSRSFILVGHCRPDVFMLKTVVSRAVPDAQVHAVNDEASLNGHLSAASVLLVNRVLDGRFSSEDGIALIGQVSGREDPPVSILISNFEDYQAEAVAAGAKRGFGKSDLYHDETAEILREAASG